MTQTRSGAAIDRRRLLWRRHRWVSHRDARDNRRHARDFLKGYSSSQCAFAGKLDKTGRSFESGATVIQVALEPSLVREKRIIDGALASMPEFVDVSGGCASETS